MGNNASTESSAKEDVTPRTSNSTPTSRRIVKAKRIEIDNSSHNSEDDANTSSLTTRDDSKEEDEAENHHSRRSYRSPEATVPASYVARELQQEQVEQVKQEMKQNSAQRKAERQKEMLDKRRRNSEKNISKDIFDADHDNSDTDNLSKSTSALPSYSSPRPNPMSKYMRSFSVEPEHPEHKRRGSTSSNKDANDKTKMSMQQFLSKVEATFNEKESHSNNDNDEDAQHPPSGKKPRSKEPETLSQSSSPSQEETNFTKTDPIVLIKSSPVESDKEITGSSNNNNSIPNTSDEPTLDSTRLSKAVAVATVVAALAIAVAVFVRSTSTQSRIKKFDV